MVYICLAVAVFLLDFWIKNKVENEFDNSTTREILNGRIRLRKVYNRGAAFNLLEKKSQLVKYISAALTAGTAICLIAAVLQKGRVALKLGLGILAGGAASNLYDRCSRGYVVDYFSFKTKIKRLGKIVFNISDMFIFLGSIILILADSIRPHSR